jgi:hypothetical protein
MLPSFLPNNSEFPRHFKKKEERGKYQYGQWSNKALSNNKAWRINKTTRGKKVFG